MSWCRWSSDDFQCDVYVYDDVLGGITTHVATRRVIYSEPLTPPIEMTKENFAEWWERHEKVSTLYDRAEKRAIGLPHDGQTFNDETEVEAAARLEYLKGLGYWVPQYVIDGLLGTSFSEGE